MSAILTQLRVAPSKTLANGQDVEGNGKEKRSATVCVSRDFPSEYDAPPRSKSFRRLPLLARLRHADHL
jgi:hypothetical protein